LGYINHRVKGQKGKAFMVIYKKVFGLILVLLAVFAVSALATEVAEDVSGVWSPEYNPYNVVGDLRVPKDSTLIIQPGCYINFAGHYKFVVDTNALLIAEGNESDSIYFTASDTTIGWLGLRFFNADTNCYLGFCVFEYGKAPDHGSYPYCDGGAIYGSFANIIIDHCVVRNNRAWEGRGGGIYWLYGKLSLSNSAVTNNFCGFDGSGISGGAANVSIDNCYFDGNTTYYPLGGEEGGAISLSNCPQVEITNNVITRNFSGLGGGGDFYSSINDNHKQQYHL
jgi:hypothetical protein